MADQISNPNMKRNSDCCEVTIIDEDSSPNIINIDDSQTSCIDISDDVPEMSVKNMKTQPTDMDTKLKEENGVNVLDISDDSVELVVKTDDKDVQTSFDCEKGPPSITITFSNNELFDLHKEKFTQFLQSIGDFALLQKDLHLKLVKSGRTDLPDWQKIENTDKSHGDDVVNKLASKKRRRWGEINENVAQEENLFIVDTEPCIEVGLSPIYKSKYKVISDNDDKEEDDESKDRPVGKVVCFNCNGEHFLKDCPLPKDMQRIKMARQKHKTVRYHQEEDNRFSHLKPGCVSEKLRKALGMRRSEIPAHVYKMRTLGYPPGWLEEAKEMHSNLSLFNSDGKEDGGSLSGKEYSINPEKIVEYPGFNCEPEQGSRDEYKYYHVPPYSTALSKENMISFVNKMLDQNAEKLNKAKTPCQTSKREDSSSPTLIDLEAQKKQLLEQLTSSEDSNMSNNQITDLNQTVEAENSIDMKITETPVAEVENPSTVVKSSLMGTPILKSLSPYSRLPNPDNFSKDVSPVINFENLPNSTGKYEQMTVVLNKVRTTLKTRLQDNM